MPRIAAFIFVLQGLAAMATGYDLAAAKSEANLERRSELALTNANAALDEAKNAYQQGNFDKAAAADDEVAESVELAYESLAGTGKDGRHNPKFFKKAELSTRQILRRLEGLIETVGVDDRPALEKVRARVADVHDDLIQAIMGKKRSK